MRAENPQHNIQSVADVGVRAAASCCVLDVVGRETALPGKGFVNAITVLPQQCKPVRSSLLSSAGGLVQVDRFAKDNMLADWPQQETSHANGHRPAKAK